MHTPELQRPQPTDCSTARRWYGWQTLLVDAVATATFLFPAPELTSLGLFASGPIVHAAHGNTANAWGSVGLRVGAVGGGIGLGIAYANTQDCGNSSLCGYGFMAVGGALGMLVAVIVDATVLAYDDVPPPAPRPAALRLTPGLSVSDLGAMTTVTGSF